MQYRDGSGTVTGPRSGLTRPQLVEDMLADHVHLLQALGPVGPDVFGVVMRRAADFGEVGLALEHRAGDLLGLVPRIGFGGAKRLAFAREGELAGEVAVAVLVDHTAD